MIRLLLGVSFGLPPPDFVIIMEGYFVLLKPPGLVFVVYLLFGFWTGVRHRYRLVGCLDLIPFPTLVLILWSRLTSIAFMCFFSWLSFLCLALRLLGLATRSLGLVARAFELRARTFRVRARTFGLDT